MTAAQHISSRQELVELSEQTTLLDINPQGAAAQQDHLAAVTRPSAEFWVQHDHCQRQCSMTIVNVRPS